jgi:hypothetical protein
MGFREMRFFIDQCSQCADRGIDITQLDQAPQIRDGNPA